MSHKIYLPCLILENADCQNLCKLEDLSVSEKLFCSFCNSKFVDQVQQRWHYKLDWHRYNLKQKLNGLEPITEEKFTQLAGLSITFESKYVFSYFNWILGGGGGCCCFSFYCSC
jgi:hypothetical protein